MAGKFEGETIVTAVCVAGYAALTLGYVAHYDFGFSRTEIRDSATIVAILLAVLVAIDFFGKKLSKAKRP